LLIFSAWDEASLNLLARIISYEFEKANSCYIMDIQWTVRVNWVDISFLVCKEVSVFCFVSVGLVLSSLDSKSIPSEPESCSACAVVRQMPGYN
jgi:hypothetical protein